jgi:hypothetical protein
MNYSEILAQLVINEGSNKNLTILADEDGTFPDWIELANKNSFEISLQGYHLTDDSTHPDKWTFPDIIIPPNGFKYVFCSGKDRKPVSIFQNVATSSNFTPVSGWNTHNFSENFYWDGVSNLLINTCSYNSTGYTTNSIFKQTTTSYLSTVYAAQDYSDVACSYDYGTAVYLRPNMKINGKVIGNGNEQNSATSYPAPYGNWYWSARNQMLIRASELLQAGLTSGDLTSLAFRVVSTNANTHYDYFQINIKQVADTAVSYHFQPNDPNISLHTNFKISSGGETIYLYSPDNQLVSKLYIHCNNIDNSVGCYPDGSASIRFFDDPTPDESNLLAVPFSGYLLEPVVDVPAGIYSSPITVTLSNPNQIASTIYYTLNGSDPDNSSIVYNGQPITVSSSKVLKARVINTDNLPSKIKSASYLFDIEHTTPIISVITANSNLYGANGMFDNWWLDMDKPAFIDFFDSTNQLIFSKNVGIQMDGGAGGSRSQPQHSFRIELDHSVLGDGSVNYPMIPDRPNRLKYSRLYLRNGSNQYLVLPYKDAAQVRAMGKYTNTFYSAWRPVSVYINGSYFGLYELREKLDKEFFNTLENPDNESIDILSQSYWYGGMLRPVEGKLDGFYEALTACNTIDPADTAFWTKTDQYFDLKYYTDYIIAESWMANTDWPYNNIKLYRSDKTGFRWRYGIIDLELCLAPNGWNDNTFDHIKFMLEYDPNNPYLHLWQRGITNGRFKNYFINRYADIMNTAYKPDLLTSIENNIYQLVKPEMPKEYERWGDPNNVTGQMISFIQNHSIFRQQLAGRNDYVRQHLMNHFELPNLVDVTLDVEPYDGGTIKISTLNPDEYPWQGIYFNGLPVKIEAVPFENYVFIGWERNELLSDTLNSIYYDTLSATNVNFKAHFISTVSAKPLAETKGLTVYPNPASDFIYLHNDDIGKLRICEYAICSINGTIAQSGKLSYSNVEQSLNIKQLTPAIYVLKVKCENQPDATFRFVKY